MASTMRARYDIPTNEVQIFMSLTEFDALLKELNHPKIKDPIRSGGLVAEWFREMCDSLRAAVSLAGDGRPNDMMTIMTGWWHTPGRD